MKLTERLRRNWKEDETMLIDAADRIEALEAALRALLPLVRQLDGHNWYDAAPAHDRARALLEPAEKAPE